MNQLTLRAIRMAVIGNAAFFALIFIPAWTLNYWQGWALFVTLSIPTALVTVYLAFTDPELLERRLSAGPRAEKTVQQKIITAVGLLFYVAMIVVMIFDHRFAWSPAMPAYVSIIGDALGVLGIFTYFLVVKENRYAAATVDVVEGQTVVSTGPYAIVRHPMYTGALLVFAGMPLALGSWWGLVFVPVFVAGFGWRLLHEERYLRDKLGGYADYMRKVRFRLVPYIW